MNQVYDISSSCLRYIIPFKYSESFDEAIEKVEQQGSEILVKNKDTGEKYSNDQIRPYWNRLLSKESSSESDLYDYVRNEFCFDDELSMLKEQKVGCGWLFWRSENSIAKDGKPIKKLVFYPTGIRNGDSIKSDGITIFISNMGLLLFRNGLGIIWYELKIPTRLMNSDCLKLFQNTIKELNRSNVSRIWEEQNSLPKKGIIVSEINGYKTYLSPFSFGNWIHDTIRFLSVTYFAERKNAFRTMQNKSMKYIQGISNTIIDDGIEDNEDCPKIPDKAILFTYASLINRNNSFDDNNRYSLLYHLTNGYKDSYHYSDSIASEICKPFDNALWYATQEGSAYLAWPEHDNKEVFDSLLPAKIQSDYFLLYLKVLYQSFSLLIYAEKIQTVISAVNGKYLREPFSEKITELFGEINLFLAKSMATSVSHIHHQSDFYNYIKKQLRIKEDVESVISGLNALDILQREQRQREENRRVEQAWHEEQRRDHDAQLEREAREARQKKSDEKIQAIMGLFALLGISSALVDCFDFIGKFDPDGDYWKLVQNTQWWEIIFFVIIGIISSIAVYFSVKAIVNAFRNKD